MPTPKSAARIALDQYLADGQWHDRADAIEHIAPHVPPGQAVRRADWSRRIQRERAGQTGPAAPNLSHPQDDQAVGAHDIAMRLIAERIRRGAIEKTTATDGTVLIRRTPSP